MTGDQLIRGAWDAKTRSGGSGPGASHGEEAAPQPGRGRGRPETGLGGMDCWMINDTNRPLRRGHR